MNETIGALFVAVNDSLLCKQGFAELCDAIEALAIWAESEDVSLRVLIPTELTRGECQSEYGRLLLRWMSSIELITFRAESRELSADLGVCGLWGLGVCLEKEMDEQGYVLGVLTLLDETSEVLFGCCDASSEYRFPWILANHARESVTLAWHWTVARFLVRDERWRLVLMGKDESKCHEICSDLACVYGFYECEVLAAKKPVSRSWRTKATSVCKRDATMVLATDQVGHSHTQGLDLTFAGGRSREKIAEVLERKLFEIGRSHACGRKP
ncbi:MAG: hypothetical protein KDK70_15485 [Myxococcales bacterium]|nr:hypothetical protein [Myxococcales bacterium]